jgi:hypothetical protein
MERPTEIGSTFFAVRAARNCGDGASASAFSSFVAGRYSNPPFSATTHSNSSTCGKISSNSGNSRPVTMISRRPVASSASSDSIVRLLTRP